MTAFESGNCPAGRPGVGERALPYGFRPDPLSVIQDQSVAPQEPPFVHQFDGRIHVPELAPVPCEAD